MNAEKFLEKMNNGERVAGGSEAHKAMHELSQRALKITAEINNVYHTAEELRSLMSELIGKQLDDGFGLFPPFNTDCGLNIHIGKKVFINSGCKFQDQGGIYIGDNVLVGHNVVLATLNHDLDPVHRADMIPQSIHIGNNVWIGSNSTILGGVTIGNNAVVAAGAVVTKSIPENTVAAGVPAKIIKTIEEEN